MVEVMTDKATVELPSPVAGVVTSVGAAVGDVLQVGSPLIRIDTGNGAASEPRRRRPSDDRCSTTVDTAGSAPESLPGPPRSAPPCRRSNDGGGGRPPRHPQCASGPPHSASISPQSPARDPMVESSTPISTHISRVRGRPPTATAGTPASTTSSILCRSSGCVATSPIECSWPRNASRTSPTSKRSTSPSRAAARPAQRAARRAAAEVDRPAVPDARRRRRHRRLPADERPIRRRQRGRQSSPFDPSRCRQPRRRRA